MRKSSIICHFCHHHTLIPQEHCVSHKVQNPTTHQRLLSYYSTCQLQIIVIKSIRGHENIDFIQRPIVSCPHELLNAAEYFYFIRRAKAAYERKQTLTFPQCKSTEATDINTERQLLLLEMSLFRHFYNSGSQPPKTCCF